MFCGMRSLQNGTRCRDGMKVLWCHSHLVCLVLRVPSLHAFVFVQNTFFVTLYLCSNAGSYVEVSNNIQVPT